MHHTMTMSSAGVSEITAQDLGFLSPRLAEMAEEALFWAETTGFLDDNHHSDLVEEKKEDLVVSSEVFEPVFSEGIVHLACFAECTAPPVRPTRSVTPMDKFRPSTPTGSATTPSTVGISSTSSSTIVTPGTLSIPGSSASKTKKGPGFSGGGGDDLVDAPEESPFFSLRPTAGHEVLEEQNMQNKLLEQENVWLHKQLVDLAAKHREKQFRLTEETEAARKAQKEQREAEANERRLMLQKQNAEFQRTLSEQHGRDIKRLSRETEQKRHELEKKRESELKERSILFEERSKELKARCAEAQTSSYHQRKSMAVTDTSNTNNNDHEEQETETLEEKREKFYKQRNKDKEQHKVEMQRHVEEQKKVIRKVKHGRDTKSLDSKIEAQRQALQEKRRQEAMKKKAELDDRNQKQRQRIKREIKSGRDCKSLDDTVKKQRKSLMEQRRLEKQRREEELKRKNEEYKQRLKRAESPVHRSIHERKESIRASRRTAAASAASPLRPKVLFPTETEEMSSEPLRQRSCTNRSLESPQPSRKNKPSSSSAKKHYLPRPAATTPGTDGEEGMVVKTNQETVATTDTMPSSTSPSSASIRSSSRRRRLNHGKTVEEKRLEKAKKRNQELQDYNKSLVQRLAALTVSTASPTTAAQ